MLAIALGVGFAPSTVSWAGVCRLTGRLPCGFLTGEWSNSNTDSHSFRVGDLLLRKRSEKLRLADQN
jgi:hypothetical protein